jgi:FKBP-type peptidyl-prolyl cis-trans isomerase SlyD
MKVSMNTVVTIDFELTDSDGKTLEKSKEPICYLHGGFDNIFPKIEEAMHGKAQGDEVEVSLEPKRRFWRIRRGLSKY